MRDGTTVLGPWGLAVYPLPLSQAVISCTVSGLAFVKRKLVKREAEESQLWPLWRDTLHEIRFTSLRFTLHEFGLRGELSGSAADFRLTSLPKFLY